MNNSVFLDVENLTDYILSKHLCNWISFIVSCDKIFQWIAKEGQREIVHLICLAKYSVRDKNSRQWQLMKPALWKLGQTDE